MSTEEIVSTDIPDTKIVSEELENVEVPDWVDDVYVSRNHNCEKVDGQTMSFSGGNIVKKITKPGTGAYPVPFSIVTVHYVGRLAADGTQFDSSRDRDVPFKFMLGDKEVIKAWDIGVASMRIGETAIFNCKSDFCYGKIGNPPLIEEDADLIFEIELLEVERGRKKLREGLGKVFLSRGVGLNVPTHGTLCHVRIQGRIGNEEGPVFLNEWDEPLLIRIDDVYLPRGVEYALCSMKPEEEALFEVSPELAGNGFEPLRHTMPIPADINLYYRIELVKSEPMPETWAMAPQEKVEEARRLKDAGNEFFRSNQHERAYTRYKHALEYFEFDDVKEMEGEDRVSVNAIKVICLNNMQVVAMKDKDYTTLLQLSTDCIEIDEKHIRSRYRKAQALLGMHETEKAIDELAVGSEMIETGAVTCSEAVGRDFAKLVAFSKARLHKETSKAKKVWSKAFAQAFSEDDRPAPSPAAKEVTDAAKEAKPQGAVEPESS